MIEKPTTHSAEEVAATVRELMQRQGITAADLADRYECTLSEVQNILSGKMYMPASWAIRLGELIGTSLLYTTFGELPVMEPRFELDKIVEASRALLKTVKMEDKLRDMIEGNSLTIQEKRMITKELIQARKLKSDSIADLERLLNSLYNSVGHGKSEPSFVAPAKAEMKLHEAIEEALLIANKPLTYSEIAELINKYGLYRRKDGNDVPSSQISARIKTYGSHFKVMKGDGPALIDLNKK